MLNLFILIDTLSGKKGETGGIEGPTKRLCDSVLAVL